MKVQCVFLLFQKTVLGIAYVEQLLIFREFFNENAYLDNLVLAKASFSLL